MDFELTHEQQLLGTTADRLLSDHGATRSPEVLWGTLSELGVLGACLPEADGGFGGGGVETMVLMQAFGRACSAAPYLARIVLGAGVLAEAGSQAQRAEILTRVMQGGLGLAFAHMELAGRYRLAHVRTHAVAVDGGFVLRGTKGLIVQAAQADMLVVSARVRGADEDEDGIGLFLVAADAPGLRLQDFETQDGLGAAMVTLDGVRVAPDAVLGVAGNAWPVIRRVHDSAIAAVCAEALGAMEQAHRLTLDYLATRQQFGQKLGSFQALQHRAVDMFVALELARSMTMYAAVMADEPDPSLRASAMSAAKIRVCRSARLIAQEAIQLHGAIGLTEEYALGRHARRLAMIEMQFGDIDHHASLLVAGMAA